MAKIATAYDQRLEQLLKDTKTRGTSSYVTSILTFEAGKSVISNLAPIVIICAMNAVFI